jgi:ribonuclease G
MTIQTSEKCPSCGGTGEIQPAILMVDQIENNLRYLIKEQNEKNITLCVHPFIEAYLSRGFFSIRRRWAMKMGGKISLRAVSSYHFMEYHFLNKNDDEIKL